MRCHVRSSMFVALFVVASCTTSPRTVDGDCDALDPARLVVEQPGSIPVVITSTHAGSEVPRDCHGNELELRACEPELDDVCHSGPCRAGGADRGARLMTFSLVEELEKCLGARPHLVLSEVERTVVDVNRDARDTGGQRCALEDKDALPAWEAFHHSVEKAIALASTQVTEGQSAPLLVDLHTYNSLPAAPSPSIMIGTGEPFGTTLPHLGLDDPELRKIFGDGGFRSRLLTGMRAIDRDAQVKPASRTSPLDGLYRGRYVVHRYSRVLDDDTKERGPAVDAIQIEVSAGLRDQEEASARAIADALCGAFGDRWRR